MDDSNNNIKIGIAKDPEKRKGTLMAQEPNIKLIEKYLFPNRKVAHYHEQYLHKEYIKYNTNNGKGEWFDFEKEKLNEVKEALNKFSLKKKKMDNTLF